MAPDRDYLDRLRAIANRIATRILSLSGLERALLAGYAAGCSRRYSEFRLIAKEATERSGTGRAIEIGMGPAPTLLHCLASQFQGELLGTDIEPRCVAMSSHMWKSRSNSSSASFLVCAGEFLPFSDDTFDLMLSVNSLHHWNDPRKVFTEVKRILKPCGRGVIADFRRDLDKGQLKTLEAKYSNPILRYRLRRSVSESYLPAEINHILEQLNFTDREVMIVPNGLTAKMTK